MGVKQGEPGPTAAGCRLCPGSCGRRPFVRENLHQRECPSRAARLSGALRGSRRAPRGLLPSGRAGENLSRRAVLRETRVTHSDNNSGVPGPGSALPPQTPGPRGSGAEGQRLLCPRPTRGHTQRQDIAPRPPPSHRGHCQRVDGSGQGAGLPCQPTPGSHSTSGGSRGLEEQHSPSPGNCGSCKKQQQPHKPWWCHLSGACTFTSGFPEMCLSPFWCCQPQGLLAP